MNSNNNSWIPEIMYEESSDGSATSQLPFVPVPEGESMPTLLYVFESRETGEYEPGLSGEEVPVIQMDLHQYADMSALKENLTPDVFDVVRSALGLEPMSTATIKGRAITERIRGNVTTEDV